MVKLGFTRVYIIFLFLLKNIDCGYSLEPPRLTCTHNLCFEQKYEKYHNFLSENNRFLDVKFCIYLNRRVFVMEHSIFIRADRLRIPRQAGIFSSDASFLCYDYHVVRWGPSRDWTLFRRKWLGVIINDDFLEKGECYGLALLPSIICLGRFRMACRYILLYIPSLTNASASRLFGSVVRALEFYAGRPGSNPTTGRKFFQLCFIPLLRLSCKRIHCILLSLFGRP